MLQMNCSNCDGLIKSPLLAEMQVVTCSHCKEIVAVNNVVVATKTLSESLRSSLVNLLVTAKDTFRKNKSENQDAQHIYAYDKRLAKLLRRDDFRLDLSFDLYVQLHFDDKTKLARLLNISSTGAAMEFTVSGELPETISATKIQFLFPGKTETLPVVAKVVWRSKPAGDALSPSVTMGVQFQDVDVETRACLWDFIVNAETSLLA